MKIFDFSDLKRIISLIIAFIFFICTLSFFLLSISRIFQPIEDTLLSPHFKLNEFNSGLKTVKKTRFYTPMIIFRRYFFVIWLILLSSAPSILLVSGMIIFQICYIIILIYMRPFEDPINNFIECLNELLFTLLVSILSIENTKGEWSGSLTSLYIWIMLFNTMMVTVILTGKLFYFNILNRKSFIQT